MRLSPSFLGVTPDAVCEKWATVQIIAEAKLTCCREKTDALNDLPLLQHTLLLRALVQGSADLQLQRVFAFTALIKVKFPSSLRQRQATGCSGHTPQQPARQAYFNQKHHGERWYFIASLGWNPIWRQLCLKPMSLVCLHHVSSGLILVMFPCAEVSVYPVPRLKNGYGLRSHWNNTSQKLWNCYEMDSCDVTGTEAFYEYETLPLST